MTNSEGIKQFLEKKYSETEDIQKKDEIRKTLGIGRLRFFIDSHPVESLAIAAGIAFASGSLYTLISHYLSK